LDSGIHRSDEFSPGYSGLQPKNYANIMISKGSIGDSFPKEFSLKLLNRRRVRLDLHYPIRLSRIQQDLFFFENGMKMNDHSPELKFLPPEERSLLNEELPASGALGRIP
jgi:hypothetical protein